MSWVLGLEMPSLAMWLPRNFTFLGLSVPIWKAGWTRGLGKTNNEHRRPPAVRGGSRCLLGCVLALPRRVTAPQAASVPVSRATWGTALTVRTVFGLLLPRPVAGDRVHGVPRGASFFP